MFFLNFTDKIFQNIFQNIFQHTLMVTSVNKTPGDEIDNNTSFHFCN